ncbi:MAG: SGNH hydrolase domain-containing protein [Cyanobacteriota bacterium]
MVNLRPNDIIVLSSILPRYFTGLEGGSSEFFYFLDNGQKVNAQIAFLAWMRKLREIVKYGKTKGIKVIVVLPTPHFEDYPGSSLCSEQSFRPLGLQGCRIGRDKNDIYAKWQRIIEDLKALSSSSENLFLFDPSNVFC